MLNTHTIASLTSNLTNEENIRIVKSEINILDFYFGLRKSISEEMDSIFCSISNTYKSILQAGRNNNSEIAIQIREYTDSLFEMVEEIQNQRKF